MLFRDGFVAGIVVPNYANLLAADVVDSRYLDDTIPLINLLRPYPQFDGNFEGLPKLVAMSRYNSLQIRFQKRASHYISFEGNYTFSRATDDSSAGRNAWIGNLQYWIIRRCWTTWDRSTVSVQMTRPIA